MAQPALRAALVRLGLSQDAATYATDTIGLDSLDAWRDFHTDIDLDGLSRNLRNPGGLYDPPDGGPPTKHPGFPVSVMALSNINVLRLALKYHQQVQRIVAPADVTAAWIARWEFLIDFRKETAKKTSEDEDLPKVTMTDWAKTKEKILNHFNEVYGKDGIPLSYILRETSAVKPAADDPQAGYDGDHVKELITRATHDGDTYRADNRTMCRLLKKICGDTTSYTYISKYTADGRQAWTDLMDAFLGPQHTQNQAAIYEAKLQQSRYDGESRNFSFQKYADIHKSAHEHLDALPEYKGMDEGTKIRHCLNNIHSDKLKTVIELVRGNPSYPTFDSVVRRIKDSVVVEQPTKYVSRKVSAVSLTDSRGEEIMPNVEADMNVEDKYYTGKEWHQLSAAKKKGVMHKRKQRGHHPGKGKGGGGGGGGGKSQPGKSSLKKMRKTVSKLQRKVASLNLDSDSSGEEDEEAPPKKKSKKGSN